MKKETFEKEIAMCQNLSRKNKGRCHWGECDKCGVLPLLYKLSKGKMYEKENEVKELRESILK